MFCKKSKYNANTKARNKLRSMPEFRADETVRTCASLHVKLKSGNKLPGVTAKKSKVVRIHADDFIFLLVLSQSLCRCYLKRRSRAKTRI